MSSHQRTVPPWLPKLVSHVKRHRLGVIRLSERDWSAIANSRRGKARFTVARPHAEHHGLHAPTACLVIAGAADELEVQLGVVESIQPVTTLDSRAKVVDPQPLMPHTEEEVVQLLARGHGRTRLRSALKSSALVSLGPIMSARLVAGLARETGNWPALSVAAHALGPRRTYAGPADLQSNAVATALRAFGVGADQQAESLEVAYPDASTLEQIRISEDAVIEHDARSVEGFRLAQSDLTGKAVFVNDGGEVLEIITANRRPLEHVFGVDLIYLNAVMQNVVMVQYKMLEQEMRGTRTDWVFRPNEQFRQEVDRMRFFAKGWEPGPEEYRISQEMFYLKFVRRDAALGSAPIVMPLEHFDRLKDSPASWGPKGGFRVSYDSLDGRYLRQATFLGLIRDGYIGAYAQTAAALRDLIEEGLRNGKGLVAAVHAARRQAPAPS